MALEIFTRAELEEQVTLLSAEVLRLTQVMTALKENIGGVIHHIAVHDVSIEELKDSISYKKTSEALKE